MRQPPPLSSASHYPATAATAIGAAGLSVAWWGGADLGHLTAPLVGLETRPWTLFTSSLLHGGVLHLVFNLYWLWVFGTAIEQVYGTARTAGLYLFLAALAGVIEYALFQHGIGLSGVGYGLFTTLWVLGRRRPRFADAVDRNVVFLFVGWFFLCVLMTYTAGWRIGNIAHLAGALIGAATGAAITGKRQVRYAARVGLVVACVVAGWMAFNARVPVAFTAEERVVLAHNLSVTGVAALGDEDTGEAIEAFEAAVRVMPDDAGLWYSLGVTYEEADRMADAERALRRAAELAPDNEEIVEKYEALVETRNEQGDGEGER